MILNHLNLQIVLTTNELSQLSAVQLRERYDALRESLAKLSQ